MNAAEARKLRVGDWVVARFGGRGVSKSCEITQIVWPTFTLKTTDYRGDEMVRTRRYESLVGPCQPNRPATLAVDQSPSWLKWPNND